MTEFGSVSGDRNNRSLGSFFYRLETYDIFSSDAFVLTITYAMVNIKYVFKISFTHGSCCHTGHYTYPSKKFHSTSLNAVNCQHHRLSLHIQEKSGGEVELHSLFWSVYFDLPSLE